MGQRFCIGSSSSFGNRNHELWFDSCPPTRGGLSFPERRVRPSERVTCSAASLAPRVRGPGRRSESFFQKQICSNPRCSKVQDADYPNPAPPPPTRRPEPAAGVPQRREPPANAPTLPPAPKCNGEKAPKQTHSAEPSQSRPGRDQAAGDRPPARPLQENTRDFPPRPPLLSAPAFPAGLLRPLVPAAVPGSPSLCSPESESMLPAGRPQPPARPRSARDRPASGLGLPRRTLAGQCAEAAARGPLGRGYRRPHPVPRSPSPPAGACLPGERGAEGGARRESAGTRAGRREWGGAGASGAPRAPDWG